MENSNTFKTQDGTEYKYAVANRYAIKQINDLLGINLFNDVTIDWDFVFSDNPEDEKKSLALMKICVIDCPNDFLHKISTADIMLIFQIFFMRGQRGTVTMPKEVERLVDTALLKVNDRQTVTN